MKIASRIVNWLLAGLPDVKMRGAEQSAEVKAAVAAARQERVQLELAVQSRSWKQTS